MLASTFTLDEFAPVGYDAWRAMVEQELAGAPFDKKLVTRLYEGIALQPIYTEKDWPQAGDPSGFPGADPFTRGSTALRQAWEIRQACNHPDPAVANQEILDDLQNGATGVLIRLDAATRAGVDADAAADAISTGEASGLIVSTLADLATVLDNVNAEAAPVCLASGAAFLPTAALLAALLKRQGGHPRGNLGADPLGALAADGLVAGSVETALEQLGVLAVWTVKNLPGMTSATVSTSPYHDAGATTTLDLALAIATGVQYLRAMTTVGLNIDAACGQVAFSLSIGTEFFRGIAKLRAARKLWARVAEACGASEAARAMRLHATTARRVLTRRDPWVNILRATVACFAGVVGGADAITVEPYDARLGLATEPTRRLARNTQIVLQEEAYLGRVVDPAGGCWFLEKLTDELAEAAWKLFQEIEAQGGAAKALVGGWVAEKIGATWDARLKNIKKRKDAITGVSEFPNLSEKLPETAQADMAALRKAASAALAAARGDAKGQAALAALAALAKLAGAKGADLVAALVAAAEAGATLGAMTKALGVEAVKAIDPLPLRPLAGPFEDLRDASDAHLAKTASRPKVFLANIGPIAHHTARATYARNFFKAGGFDALSNKGFPDGGAAAEAFKASGAAIVVICSSDKIYETKAAQVAQALKAAGARTVVLAGRPSEQNKPAWTAAGMDLFIYRGCDAHAILGALLKQEGAWA
jgi:methylmalonyl-CoA mutase